MLLNINFFYVSVGEPLNKEAWQWYHSVVGEKRCTVVDTYWQTGTYICAVSSAMFLGLLSILYMYILVGLFI